MNTPITSFRNEFEFLSNSYPVNVEFEGETYPSVEHAFQAAKTNDSSQRFWIRVAQTASEAKSFGGDVTITDPDWDTNRVNVMRSLVTQKFTSNFPLKLKLLLTGQRELIQGGMWKDQFWGVDKLGQGENHLGQILMAVREELRTTEGTAQAVLAKFLASSNLEFISTQIQNMVLVLSAAASDDPKAECPLGVRESLLQFVEGLQ